MKTFSVFESTVQLGYSGLKMAGKRRTRHRWISCNLWLV